MSVKNEVDKEMQPSKENKNDGPAYWRKWYAAVIIFLVAQVVLYYVITQHFK